MDALAGVMLRALGFLGLSALAMTGLELAAPARRTSRPRWWGGRGASTDACHAVLGPLWLHPLAVALYALLARGSAALEPPGVAAVIERVPWGLRVVAAVVLADAGAYVAHRLAHRVPWLWTFHAVHHASEEVDWLASFRMHPMDSLLHVAAASAPFFALRVPAAAVPWLLLALRLHAVFVHANLRAVPRWLAPWIAGPSFHRAHHEVDGDARNFATLFPLFDRCFGTWADPPDDPSLARYGTTHPVSESYLGQLAGPFGLAPRTQHPQETPR